MRRGALASLLIVAACGAENSLEGSIGQSLPLSFDSVRIRKEGISLVVEYLKTVSGGTSKVCKLAIDTEQALIADGLTIDGDAFHEAVDLERVASTGGDFPEVERGEVSFAEAALEADAVIEGEFDVVFVNGRNLLGDFAGRLEVEPD